MDIKLRAGTLDPRTKAKLDKLRLLEAKKAHQASLPHLYGFKDYLWSQEFFQSSNRMCLLTAANQIGKSTIQIRKVIHWATEPQLWPSLWRTKPVQFWYLYPSKDVATIEFETKWLPLLPTGDKKNDPQYGWEEFYDNKKIAGVRFKSGVLLIFKTYAQDAQTLQSGTCDYIACDEELPAELYDELKFRLAASHGYFSCVFTATLGQEFWREAMEEQGTAQERFPMADKWQVSMYDCLLYVDGTKSHWTEARILEIIADCQDEAEVQRRVFGKFVLSKGRKYAGFSIKANCKHGGVLPKDWRLYAGIDYGSGGETGHPAAIVFIGVNPEYTAGRVCAAWRGDGITTTAGDVVQQFVSMKQGFVSRGYEFLVAWYDHSAKDLKTIADRLGEPLVAAEKSHDRGVPVLNSLFKFQALALDQEEPEVMKLANELTSLRSDTPKNKAKDNLADGARYGVVLIPWNWTIITPPEALKVEPKKEPTETEKQNDARRQTERPLTPEEEAELEFEEWNEAYEA